MAFSFKQRRKIPFAGPTVNLSLRCSKNRHKSNTFMSMIRQRIVNLYRSKNKQIIIKYLR
ncbi:glyceraldehyde-3-phosphate dehydrogenase [Enterobacter asburiae]|nr:glyceraldehyde-3-phosphate dehydrogenase [Enterobacter asburiae]KJX12681.1 glyceraldehyde-3-phosphate dehydrogenase [Enterobacter asburiae]KLF88746.1 glyceraldehyde-3-phosphate dehydrogenase [Enterobacter asburiae]KLP43952.1 glyceraldehyde-3-phosphate dehydrogenase [Enterobacter asburiae]OJX59843.1 MAG: glyceraldehyde-3-phosphate dehydrogenase [Enterobacter sp. 56-7]